MGVWLVHRETLRQAQGKKKEGLRCECGKLLLEKDPEMGLGVRCGRRECDKFHPLEEINQRAAEFKKEKRREKMESVLEKETRIKIIKENPEGYLVCRTVHVAKGELLPLAKGDEISLWEGITQQKYRVAETKEL